MKNLININLSLLLCLTSIAFSVHGQDSGTTDEGIVINGIRWATRNVDMPGTFTANPEDAGMFYQWNRYAGWSNNAPRVNSYGGNTWNGGEEPGETWIQETNPCPAGWRVPTEEEWRSLDSTSSSWGKKNGVSGRFFNAKNPIFLPAAGSRYYNAGTLYGVGSTGCYWSCTISGTSAYSMNFGGTTVNPSSVSNRAYGFCVRCVADE
ncbi:MAG: fibrobacter succinogenes major paralogous domain-containing protein [Bacteroidales bacterium]|nr:fibrobacter succinogenes major paralogous domain-containing protein [Bacteroidales bacterium]